VEHDRRYYAGGTLGDKWAADKALAVCVGRAGAPVLGAFMLIGSQVAGVPWLPTQFRWGFGRARANRPPPAVGDCGDSSEAH
jgi:hypothetical protein